MNKLPLLLLCLLIAGTAEAQISSCPCGTTKGGHLRKNVKDRPIPSPIAPGRTATIREMIRTWDITNDQFSREPAQNYPREDTLFLVKGYLHRAKIASDDCDFHLEIAASRSKTAKHVIAEIPNTAEYCTLRQKFLDLLKTVAGTQKVGADFVIFKTPPKITLTGYAFLDTGHWSSQDHQRGNGSHGSEYVWSLWEIHPVVDVMLE